MADPKNESETATAPVKEAVRKFRVIHGAVAGVGPDPKNPGKMKEHDYHFNAIVTDEQLNWQAPQYIIQGAIEPWDK